MKRIVDIFDLPDAWLMCLGKCGIYTVEQFKRRAGAVTPLAFARVCWDACCYSQTWDECQGVATVILKQTEEYQREVRS